MSDIALPVPDNVRVPDAARAHLVESDVFHIADRMKELDPNLMLYALDPPIHFGPKTYYWSVTEMTPTGAKLVKRFEELDARIIEDLEYMLRVPLSKRLEVAEAQEAKADAEYKEKEHEHLYEKVGAPMLRDLERTGFTQRGTSYAKRGIHFR